MDESVNNTVTEDANLMLTFVAPVSQPPSSMIAIDENQNTENVVVMVNNDVDQIINETTAVTDLNEQLTFTGECYERDGQLFMIFQNEKGEKIHVCSASATIKTDNEIVQSIDTVETDCLKTNLESNLVSAPMQIVINQNDNTVTVAENTSKIIEPSIEEPFMESSLPLQSEQNQDEIIPLDQSIAIEKASIDTKISLEDNTDQKYSTDEIREKVTIEDSSEPLQNVEERNHSKDGEEPPQSEKNSTSDQTDLSSSTLKTSSNSIPSSSTSLRSSISINKELKPISPSSQLAKSPQTYSKISNIVWVSLPEKKSSDRKQLTTTIEIADPNMAPEPKSNKINVINDKVNFLPKVIPKSVSSDFKVTLTNKPSTSDGLMSISLKEKAVPNIKSEEKSMTKPIIMSNKIILSPKPIEIKKVSEPPKKNDYTNIKDKIQVDDDFSIEKNKSIDKSIPSERQLRGRNSLSSNSSISETNEINTNLTKSSAIEKKTDNKILKRVSFSEPCNPPIKARSPPSSIKKISERQTYSRTKIVPEIKPTTQSLSSSTAEIDFKKQEFRRESDYCDFKINDLRVSIRIQPEFREGQFSNKSLYRENRDYQAKCLQQPEIENFKSTKIMMNKNEDRTLTELEQIETNDNSTDRKRINTRKRKSTNGSDDYVGELNNRNYESSDKDLNLESFDSDDSLAEDKSDLDEAKKISLNGFTIHDVVWIATKIGHWPALITEISMNDKRLFLRLIDCPIKKESLKVSVSSAVSFDKSSLDKFLKESEKTDKTHQAQLLRTVQKVDNYLRKRCLGSDINPFKFFNFIEYLRSETNIDDAEHVTNAPKIKNNMINIDGTSIYQFIKEGNVDNHLQAIYNGIDKAKKRKISNEEMKKDTRICFGPIKDDEQKDDLFIYLTRLYEDCRTRNSDSVIDFDAINSYIYSVWLPEAIIKAISKKHQIDMVKAEELFNQDFLTNGNENQLIKN